MLAPAETGPSPAPQGGETRDRRRRRLLRQLRAAAAPLPEQMADTLAGAPDREIFRSAEVRLRDLGQEVAASAQQAGLADRKKGATQAPAPPAPTARPAPPSSASAPTTSSASTAPCATAAPPTTARRAAGATAPTAPTRAWTATGARRWRRSSPCWGA